MAVYDDWLMVSPANIENNGNHMIFNYFIIAVIMGARKCARKAFLSAWK